MSTLIAVLAALSLHADPAAAPAPGLNDPQIATVALTAHQIDIERGKLAQKKAKTPEVKQFADQMERLSQAGFHTASIPSSGVLWVGSSARDTRYKSDFP